jgi:hypothetical protein
MLPCTVETQKLHLEPAGESLKLFRYRVHERRQSKGQNPLNSKQMPRRRGFLVRPWPRHATTSPRFPRGRTSPRQKLLHLPTTLNSSFITSARAAFNARVQPIPGSDWRGWMIQMMNWVAWISEQNIGLFGRVSASLREEGASRPKKLPTSRKRSSLEA